MFAHCMIGSKTWYKTCVQLVFGQLFSDYSIKSLDILTVVTVDNIRIYLYIKYLSIWLSNHWVSWQRIFEAISPGTAGNQKSWSRSRILSESYNFQANFVQKLPLHMCVWCHFRPQVNVSHAHEGRKWPIQPVWRIGENLNNHPLISQHSYQITSQIRVASFSHW